MSIRARWVLVSWAVFAVALSWQHMELRWSMEAETLLREQSSLLERICAGENDVAGVAEQVCLPCEKTQRDWIGVLGAHQNSRGRGRFKRASGNIGGGR